MKEKIKFLKQCSFSVNIMNNLIFLYTSSLLKSQPEVILSELNGLKNTSSYTTEGDIIISISLLEEFISYKETSLTKTLLLSGNKIKIQLALNLL